MSNSPVPLALCPVADLCNTVNRVRGTDLLADLSSAQSWARTACVASLETAPVTADLDSHGLTALVRARGALSAFLWDRQSPDARTEFNAVAAIVLGSPAIGPDGTLVIPVRPTDVASAISGHAVAALLTHGLAGDGVRLKGCANPECGWIFYDSSRPRSGRWCDMSVCGARMKMRRYRNR